MRYSLDFPDGPVTDRVISILLEQDAKTINHLIKTNKLRFYKPGSPITNKNLLCEYLGDYVAGSGYSLQDVLFGFGVKAKPNYTDNDALVIRLLNFIPDHILDRLFISIQEFFPNAFFHELSAEKKISKRIYMLFSRLPRNGFSKKLSTVTSDLPAAFHEDVERFYKVHRSVFFVFNSNYSLEYAQVFGVSLHWLWNPSLPLYTDSLIADRIFDYYTLMQPNEQKEFALFLLHYVEQEKNKLSKLAESEDL